MRSQYAQLRPRPAHTELNQPIRILHKPQAGAFLVTRWGLGERSCQPAPRWKRWLYTETDLGSASTFITPLLWVRSGGRVKRSWVCAHIPPNIRLLLQGNMKICWRTKWLRCQSVVLIKSSQLQEEEQRAIEQLHQLLDGLWASDTDSLIYPYLCVI